MPALRASGDGVFVRRQLYRGMVNRFFWGGGGVLRIRRYLNRGLAFFLVGGRGWDSVLLPMVYPDLFYLPVTFAEPEPRILGLHGVAVVFPALEAKAVVVDWRLTFPQHVNPVGSDVAPDLFFDLIRYGVAKLVFKE